MNVDYSAYEGFQVRGYPETVLSRGRVVVDKGEYVGRPGDGRFIKRGPYGGAHAAAAPPRTMGCRCSRSLRRRRGGRADGKARSWPAADRGMPSFRAAGCGAEAPRVRDDSHREPAFRLGGDLDRGDRVGAS